MDEPTIADLFAYCEIAQVPQLGIMEVENSRVSKWINRISGIEHHDDVHRSLFKLSAIFQKAEEKRREDWAMKVFDIVDFDSSKGLQREVRYSATSKRARAKRAREG